jgi:hypothetical protein
MRKILSALSIMIAAAMPAGLMAQEFSGFSFDSAVYNKYIWRGIVFGTESVIQPSVSAGYGNLSFNVWGNMALSDGQNYDLELNEIDYTFDYSQSLGELGISVGAIYYTFPSIGTGETTELYAGLSISSVLNPSITYYQDVQEAEGGYLLLGVAPSIPIDAWSTSLDLAMSLGVGTEEHNSFYYGTNSSSVTDFMLGLSIPFRLTDRASLVPSIAFVNLVDSEIRDVQSSDENILVGLSFSTSF